MLAVKATFDGERIVLPADMGHVPPGNVIVIFEDGVESADKAGWMRGQEAAFAAAWDNADDEIYDTM